jgi:hypothetical protein
MEGAQKGNGNETHTHMRKYDENNIRQKMTVS